MIFITIAFLSVLGCGTLYAIVDRFLEHKELMAGKNAPTQKIESSNPYLY